MIGVYGFLQSRDKAIIKRILNNFLFVCHCFFILSHSLKEEHCFNFFTFGKIILYLNIIFVK